MGIIFGIGVILFYMKEARVTLFLCFKISNMNKVLASFILLLTVVYTRELCSSEAYDTYLKQYPLKCSIDCEKYKTFG